MKWILIFIPFLSFGQVWKPTKNDAIIAALQLVAGSADAYHEMIANHKYGEGNSFFDIRTSWKNKYKDWDSGDHRAAFPGSKTWLVGFTDGYHLTRTIDRACTLFSIGMSACELKQYHKKDRWKVVVRKVLISAISNRLAFNLIYR